MRDCCWGDPALLEREALGVVVAAMSMENVLTRLTEGAVVVAPGDRADVLVGVLLAHASGTFPSLDRRHPERRVRARAAGAAARLRHRLDACRSRCSNLGTYDVLRRITQTRGPPRRRLAAKVRHRARAVRRTRRRRRAAAPPRGEPVERRHAAHVRVRHARARTREPQAHRAAGGQRRPHPASRQRPCCSARSRSSPSSASRRPFAARATELGLDISDADVIDPSTSDLRLAVRRRVRAHPLAQGRDGRAGQRHRHRRLLLRHDDGAPRTRRRDGVGRRAHDRQHHPARPSRSSRRGPASPSCRACS